MKENIIYIIIYLLTELLNYFLTYIVVFDTPVYRGIRKYIYGVMSIINIHVLILLMFGKEASCSFSIASMLIIPLFLINERGKKKYLLYPFVVMCSSVMGVCISFMVATILAIPEYILVDNCWWTIFFQCMSAVLLIIIMIYKRINKKKEFQINLSSKQYIIFYIVVICLFLLLSLMQKMSRGDVSFQMVNYIGVSVSIACVVLVIVTLWQGVAVSRELQLKGKNEITERYMELQKQYYIQLIEQDKKMRSFRHDMNAHMIAIGSYCHEGDLESLENYIKKIIDESAIYSVESYTGNKGVDAIIRQLLVEAGKLKIKVEIEGNLTHNVRLEEYDLCTIVYNLLKNAIEACEKIEDENKRIIHMGIGLFNAQLHIIVKNTIQGSVESDNNQLITTKKDRKYHGIGSKNVVNTVNKYNGIVKFYCEDGWFIAEISF